MTTKPNPLAVMDELMSDYKFAANYMGEGCIGADDELLEKAKEARAAVAEAFEQIAEGKRQWDHVAGLLCAVGDDVDDVFAKAAAVAGLAKAARAAYDLLALVHDETGKVGTQLREALKPFGVQS